MPQALFTAQQACRSFCLGEKGGPFCLSECVGKTLTLFANILDIFGIFGSKYICTYVKHPLLTFNANKELPIGNRGLYINYVALAIDAFLGHCY